MSLLLRGKCNPVKEDGIPSHMGETRNAYRHFVGRSNERQNSNPSSNAVLPNAVLTNAFENNYMYVYVFMYICVCEGTIWPNAETCG